MGASLLVFKNKSDVPGCMSEEDIREVRNGCSPRKATERLTLAGVAIGRHPHAQMADLALLSHDGTELERRTTMGCSRRERPSLSLLTQDASPRDHPIFDVVLAGTVTRLTVCPTARVNKLHDILHGTPLLRTPPTQQRSQIMGSRNTIG